MCGAQQLQCNPELAPQIIGAHQPIKLVPVHCFESTVTPGWKRVHSRWDSCATLSEPRSLGTVALFLISESGRGEGHSYQTAWDLQCKPQQNGRGGTFGTS